MTLLEQTYTALRQAQLVENAEQFSTAYLGKSKNWYAVQRFAGRDFSVSCAIACLQRVRALRAAQPLLNPSQKAAAQEAEADLMQHLQTKYAVAEVC